MNNIFSRMIQMVKEALSLFTESLFKWAQDKGHLMAAAISYYMMFALAPLLVILINIAGAVYGEAAVRGELFTQLEAIIGPELAAFVQLLVENATLAESGRTATILGVILLLYGASNLFYQLRMTLNFVWRIDIEVENGVLYWIRNRFLSLAMVFTLGLLALGAFALSFTLTTLDHFVTTYLPDFSRTASVTQLLLVFVLTPLLVALIFKILPDAHVAWRDVFVGAFVTALLLRVGVYVLSFFVGRYVIGSIYGAAGALVGILFFVYYSAQIMFYGAEFTQVYAVQHGRGIRPHAKAIRLVRQKPTLPEPEADLWQPIYIPPRMPIDPNETPARKFELKTAVGLMSMAIVLFVAYLIGRRWE